MRIGCELFIKGSLGVSKTKTGSMGESDLKKGVNVVMHPSPIFNKCSLGFNEVPAGLGSWVQSFS